MKGLAGGTLLVRGLGPGPSAFPPLKSGPVHLTKSGALKVWKALDFKKWGLEPSSLSNYAYSIRGYCVKMG